MTVDVKAEGRFAKAVALAMEQNQLEIRDVAEKVGTTYEAIRKLVKGMTYPSKWMMEQLCTHLDLDRDEMERLVTQDRIEHKYGATAQILAGKDPELVQHNRILKDLTPENRKTALTFLKGLQQTQNETLTARERRRVSAITR